MKRKLMVALVGAGLLAGTMVGPASADSDNASQSACFGQGRAAGVKALKATGVTPGSVLSERKGDNAAQNAAFREACQTAVAP